MNKDELLKYKELLQEIKKEKILRNFEISYSALSFISFVVLSNMQKYKYGAISALITVLGVNFLSARNKDIEYMEEQLKNYKGIKR